MALPFPNDSPIVILLCNTTQNSQICLFNTVPQSEAGTNPAEISNVSNSGSFITWEGQQITGKFSDDIRSFTTQIQGNAFNQPLNVQVGTGFHSPPFAAPPPGSTGPYGFNTFNIFKDNGRTVYTDPVLGAVTTLYYCVFSGNAVPSIPDFIPIP